MINYNVTSIIYQFLIKETENNWRNSSVLFLKLYLDNFQNVLWIKCETNSKKTTFFYWKNVKPQIALKWFYFLQQQTFDRFSTYSLKVNNVIIINKMIKRIIPITYPEYRLLGSPKKIKINFQVFPYSFFLFFI